METYRIHEKPQPEILIDLHYCRNTGTQYLPTGGRGKGEGEGEGGERGVEYNIDGQFQNTSCCLT